METLRQHAREKGYEVVAEVRDAGWSGRTLDRPGMHEVRGMVAAEGVDLVLAQDRDRFSREPAYAHILREEFKEYGTRLRALNDVMSQDDSPEGELSEGVMEQVARYQYRKLAQKGNAGKRNRARSGKIVPTTATTYGFVLSEDRERYVVDEDAMRTVRLVFEMIGRNGKTIRGAKKALERMGVPTPNGGRYWAVKTIRSMILQDAYRPHTAEEIRAFVDAGNMTAEVAARLDPNASYGIWWWGQFRHTRKVVPEVGPNGTAVFRKRQYRKEQPRSEWIAVPVPDAGIPREWVDAARAAIADNVRVSHAGNKVWELSGRIRCECGRLMSTTRQRRKTDASYHQYYRCAVRYTRGLTVCDRTRSLNAERTEAAIWGAVRELLDDEKRLLRMAQDAYEQERRRITGPGTSVVTLTERLTKIENQRARYQKAYAADAMDLADLKARMSELAEERRSIEEALAEARGRAESLEALEASHAAHVFKIKAGFYFICQDYTPEQKVEVYRELGLRVDVDVYDDLHIRFTAPFDTLPIADDVCDSEPGRASLPHA